MTIVIETELYKTLYDVIASGQYIISNVKGVMIVGPPGTGKSMSCVYLWKKFKENGIKILVLFAQSLDPAFNYFDSYIRDFVQGKCFIFLSLCTYQWQFKPWHRFVCVVLGLRT